MTPDMLDALYPDGAADGGRMRDERECLCVTPGSVWKAGYAVDEACPRLPEHVQAERTRADAAEVQRDRLAAALARVLPDYSTYRHMPDEGVLRWERAAGTLKDARAALADVPEPVRETLADPEAMAAIQRGAAEVARGEPGTPVSALRRKYDDRQHRTDAPD